MKKIVLQTLFLAILTIESHAQFQGIDTLFKHNELYYFSDLERRSLTELLNGTPDYLALAAAVNQRTDERVLQGYREWLNDIIMEIRDRKFDKIKEEKKISRIEKHISKALLLNYRLDAEFVDLFKTGDYNYVTAAAIYALVLEKLGIPYEIRELSTHIYLVSYPDDLAIRFEAGNPGQQFFMLDLETRSNFVDFIHQQGVIDDATYRNRSTKELFQQYYFSSRALSIRELTGILYINSAINFLMPNRSRDFYSQLEKAFLLYPSYKTQYLLLGQLNSYLIKKDYKNPLYLGYIIKASRLTNYGITREGLNTYLMDMVDKVLIKDEDEEGFEFIYDYLQQYLEDEELKENFTFYYLYESGRRDYNETMYGEAMDYFEAAYQMRPDHEMTQDLLTRSLAGYYTMASSGVILDKINLYDTAFTNITEKNIYLLVKLHTYLVLFGEAFQMQDLTNGEYYMAEFEKIMDSATDVEADYIQIGRSYSSAAVYYYRKGQLNKSRKVLKKGLIYAPDNIELKLKLASFK